MSVNDMWEWQHDDKMAVLIADEIKKQKKIINYWAMEINFCNLCAWIFLSIKSDKMGVKVDKLNDKNENG